MPKRPQRAPSRGSCATLSRAWRTMSAISGARGPRSASAGGASGLARSARNAATAPASSTPAAAIEIAACRKLKNRRRVGDWVRLNRRVRVTDTRVETRRGGEGGAFAPAPRGNYQSNFAPNRKRRGGTIVVGVVKLVPELQTMFAAGFVLVRL